MKKSLKTLLVIAALAVSTLTASAIKPSYRGFGEFGITWGTTPSIAYSPNYIKEE